MDKLGICPQNKIPELAGVNRSFWRVFSLMVPGLTREYGYDYNAIEVVFNNCRLSPHLREIYQGLIVVVIDVISKKRFQKDDKTCNEKKRRECEIQFGKEMMEWACKQCPENKK